MTFKSLVGRGGPKCPEPNCGRVPTIEEFRAVIENHMEPELIGMLEDMQNAD